MEEGDRECVSVPSIDVCLSVHNRIPFFAVRKPCAQADVIMRSIPADGILMLRLYDGQRLESI